MMKNIVAMPKFIRMELVSWMPSSAGRNIKKQEDMPMGINSVTQTYTQTIMNMMAFQPASVSPLGGVIIEATM